MDLKIRKLFFDSRFDRRELSRLALKIFVIARQEARVKKFSVILRFFTQFGFIVFTYLLSFFFTKKIEEGVRNQ
jgi:hypothetical protein